MTRLWLAAVSMLGVACTEPGYLTIDVTPGEAERVSDLRGQHIRGSFDLVMTVPPAGETTDVLLLSLAGHYDYARPCSGAFATLDLRSDTFFPVTVEPGTSTTVAYSYAGDAPEDKTCGPPERLSLEGTYYDSARDDYEGTGSSPLELDVPLQLTPYGQEGPPDWTCVGSAPAPAFQDGTTKGFIWVRSYGDGDVIGGAHIKVCALPDGACALPIDEGVTDVVGLWTLAVPMSGPYYFLVDGVPGFVPSLFFEYEPPTDTGFQRTLTPLRVAQLDEALAIMGVSADATRGHVAASVRDCSGHSGVGVEFDLSGASGFTAGYYDDGLPSVSALATTADAFALLANAPPVTGTLRASLQLTSDVVSLRMLHVRAGHVTFVTAEPNQGE